MRKSLILLCVFFVQTSVRHLNFCNKKDVNTYREITQKKKTHKISGDAADGMYFIEDGTVSIRIEQDSAEVEISRLVKGSYFGELALVTHRPRAASAYAEDNVKIACKYRKCSFPSY